MKIIQTCQEVGTRIEFMVLISVLSEIVGAVGLVQLKKCPKLLKK